MMQHFLRVGYRFFTIVALLMLAACFAHGHNHNANNEDDDGTDVTKRQPAISNPASTSATPQPNAATAAPAPIAAPPESYAPPTHLNKDDVGAVTGGVYAPPTQMNEAPNSVTVKVGLLIPMSGDSASLGHSLLDAAVLAVYDKYSAMPTHEITAKIELLPKDTGDSIEGAEKASQDAIQEGATLLLGPVFSKQVSAVAAIARPKNIPVISFSNNITVAGNGVYLFGFIPEQQVIRIVQYALSRQTNNIAALVPSNPYGATIVKQLSAEIRKSGGRAHPIEYYPEDLSALENNVGRLSRFLQEEANKGQALFIAEGGDKLHTIADTLAANGITPANVQLLGTGLWDDPRISKWPSVRGGWFASSPPEKYQAFEQHFVATYAYKPERLASLSYDAVALAATIAVTTQGKGFPKAILNDPVGFFGPANGIFRFHDDGSIERGLSILMVTPQGFKTIDPAPTLFNQ